MTSTTPDIVVSRTQNGSIYESKQYEITLAAVDRHGMYSWRSTCYFSDDEYDQETHTRRSDAEAVALRHAHAIIDAL